MYILLLLYIIIHILRYSSKLSFSKRFSVSLTWHILYILPCSVNLTLTTLLKNQVECTFKLSAFVHSYWFSWDILSLTKSLPENFRLLSFWDLLPRFLLLHITEFFCLQHLNLTITLSDLLIQWQVCTSFGTTFTLVNGKALQMFSSKTYSVMSAGTGFNSIVSLLLYLEFVTALRSSCVIFVSKWELNFLHCYNSELTLSYFDKKSLKFSSRLLSFVLSLTKLQSISASSWTSSSLLIFSYWLRVKTILKFIDICKLKLKIFWNLIWRWRKLKTMLTHQRSYGVVVSNTV